MGTNARPKPIRFAQDVAELLRQACCADPAVDALTPIKCRNPLYEDADVVFPTDRPPHALKTLSEPLRAYLRDFKAQMAPAPGSYRQQLG